ncbi:MAG TPA: carboxymuconolactone decarboxylase family protein [Gaiellaceae bacterium]|jgi:uncharacterized peroxidase-related enzyme
MPFIDPIPEEEASGKTADLYAADRAQDGYVANQTRAFSHRPEVFEAWRGLVGAIKERMDERRYELVTVAAARRLGCSYCMLAHGSILAAKFYGDDSVVRIVSDRRTADLDETDLAVMDLAETVAADASSVTKEDVDRLERLGLTEAEIFDVVAAAAARAFFTKVLDGLGFQPDAAYGQLAPKLRDALVVGRPIAAD